VNYITYIAGRYLFSKSHNNAINAIVKVASIGVFFASAAFIIILSGFSGIRTFNLDLIKLTDPELLIKPVKGKSFVLTDSLLSTIKQEKNIAFYAKVLEEKVFINYENKQKIAMMRGIDSTYYRIFPLDSVIILGSLPDDKAADFLIGVSLANELSMMVGSNQFVSIMVPKPGKGMITDPRKAFYSKQFMPVGVYKISVDHDAVYLYSNLSSVQELLHFSDRRISQIEIKVNDIKNIEEVKNHLREQIGKRFHVLDREEQNPLIFKMLNTENLMTYFVLALILLLALFNIIGSIMMIIIDKKNNIKTLKQLGVNFAKIKKIFFIQGFSMTMISGLSGLLLGLLIIFIQVKYPFFFLPQTNIAYPVELHLSNVFWVVITLVFLGLFSTFIAVNSLKED
jgi:lipoprotein-releasing system permease protein